MVIKCIYRIYMYKPLLINVSVSLIVSGVQPHMTLWFNLDTVCSIKTAGKYMFQINMSPVIQYQ